MNRERFEQLAQAFGGVVARWPVGEREAAAALMAAEPEFARAVLAEAEALDATLDAWPPYAVRHELREAVIARAGERQAQTGLRGWLWRAGAGAGLAAACAAGLVMGVAVYGSGSGAQATSSDEPIGAVMASYDPSGGADAGGGPT